MSAQELPRIATAMIASNTWHLDVKETVSISLSLSVNAEFPNVGRDALLFPLALTGLH